MINVYAFLHFYMGLTMRSASVVPGVSFIQLGRGKRSTLFLDEDEMRWLTGRSQKAKQIAQLRRMGIAFYVNAAGLPIVLRAALESPRAVALDQSMKPTKSWRSDHGP